MCVLIVHCRRYLRSRVIRRPSMTKLKDKVIVITGASSGIGKAIAARCALEGATVALIAHGQEKLDAARNEIESLLPCGKLRSYLCDVSDAAEVKMTVANIFADFCKVD